MSVHPPSTVNPSKRRDLLAAAPLIIFEGLCVAQQMWLLDRPMAMSLDQITQFAARASAMLLSSLWVVFLLARRTPVGKTPGLMPRIDALLGSYLCLGLVLLPAWHMPRQLAVVAALMVSAGTMFAIYGILHLGRSISIMPEARHLVTSGPYRFVRHPLYLGEGTALIGTVITFLSPLAVLLFAIQVGFLFQRMRYEEQVLGASFPEYTAYAERTARLIPRVW